jgi:hypothetical protein
MDTAFEKLLRYLTENGIAQQPERAQTQTLAQACWLARHWQTLYSVMSPQAIGANGEYDCGWPDDNMWRNVRSR